MCVASYLGKRTLTLISKTTHQTSLVMNRKTCCLMTCSDSALTSVGLADDLEHLTSTVLCLWCGLVGSGHLLFWISPPSSRWGLKSLQAAGDQKRKATEKRC